MAKFRCKCKIRIATDLKWPQWPAELPAERRARRYHHLINYSNSSGKKVNKSPCSSRCWPSGHAAGKRPLMMIATWNLLLLLGDIQAVTGTGMARVPTPLTSDIIASEQPAAWQSEYLRVVTIWVGKIVSPNGPNPPPESDEFRGLMTKSVKVTPFPGGRISESARDVHSPGTIIGISAHLHFRVQF